MFVRVQARRLVFARVGLFSLKTYHTRVGGIFFSASGALHNCMLGQPVRKGHFSGQSGDLLPLVLFR